MIFLIYQAFFKKYTEDLVRWFKSVTKFVGYPVDDVGFIEMHQKDFKAS